MTGQDRATVQATVLVAILLTLMGCAGMGADGGGLAYDEKIPVAKGSAAAGEGNTVTFQGKPLALAGTGIKVGDRLRDVQVARADLSLTNIAATTGKVRIISIVPSLDTKVCEQQTHYLSEKNQGLDRQVELITVSVDTPFAQKRFAQEARSRM
ncbi:redoxin family protein [Nitrospira sp. Kam-Ns4a]